MIPLYLGLFGYSLFLLGLVLWIRRGRKLRHRRVAEIGKDWLVWP